MNLLLWSGELSDDIIPVLQSLKDMGYDGVELPFFDPDWDYAGWGRRLDDLGLERTAVTVREEDDNPMSPDPAVRAKGVENTKKVLDSCKATGATMLVGPYHSAIGSFSGQAPTESERKYAVDSMRQMAEYAGQVGVMLCVESLNRFECYFLNTAVDLAGFVKEVNHPNCRAMYDTFHAHIEEKDVTQAIREVADVLCHVHISENDRSTPGTGSVRWTDTFETLKEVGYRGWMTVEAFGSALPELVATTKIWRRMYDTQEQLARDALAFMKAECAKRNG